MTQSNVKFTTTKNAAVQWQWMSFESLSAESLHAVLRLRAAVFVVEQNCVYQDVDGLDPKSWHLLGWSAAAPEQPEQSEQLLAYLRVVHPGARFAEVSIGRVVTRADWRGRQLGRELMKQGLSLTLAEYAGSAIRISAQQHLSEFYGSLGFEVCSPPYREDDIPHVEMLRPGSLS